MNDRYERRLQDNKVYKWKVSFSRQRKKTANWIQKLEPKRQIPEGNKT